MNHSQQYRQAYAQLRREGLDPRAAMAQAGASVGFPGVPQPQVVAVAVVPTSHTIPQFLSLLRVRRQETAADDHAVECDLGQDEEEWQDIHEGLQSYPGEPGCYDMFEHVPRWNRSPYRRRAHCARATALGIDDLDLRASTSPTCSLLRLWPVLRLGDPGDGPTFETYASFSNRVLDIFAKSARRWVGRFVVEESRKLRRRHAIRDVERQLPLPTPVCAHILEFSEG